MDMKPLSALNISSIPRYFGFIIRSWIVQRKGKPENPFSNFSPVKTHPIQLSFDGRQKVLDDLECSVHNGHLVYNVYIVCTVIPCEKCM